VHAGTQANPFLNATQRADYAKCLHAAILREIDLYGEVVGGHNDLVGELEAKLREATTSRRSP
jgi:hypothetical protein